MEAHQFAYVKQSFLLWREVLGNMMALRIQADNDMLGGGHNACMALQGVVNRIVEKGAWVGSRQLGASDTQRVMAAMEAITELAKAFLPVVECIKKLPLVLQSPMGQHIEATEECLIKSILGDFFSIFKISDASLSIADGLTSTLSSMKKWYADIEHKEVGGVLLLAGIAKFHKN